MISNCMCSKNDCVILPAETLDQSFKKTPWNGSKKTHYCHNERGRGGFYDYFRFKNPKTGFTNASFTLNPSISWASFRLGAMVDIRAREDFHIGLGIHDANGSPPVAVRDWASSGLR